ncbi:uncharacterized protein LOC143917051 [Arctopsyche grandis]|uniref:uncharacterized protein LOC143917051 n=1 Tax=Arctopsyche grandis TaxID=121162 RepID=UPI00406D6FB7
MHQKRSSTLKKKVPHGFKMRKTPLRFKAMFVIVSVLVFFCFVHLRSREDSSIIKLKFFKENHRFLDAVNATECKLPKYDLYDLQIKKYIKKPATAIDCGYPQPYLTYLDWDGTLYLNESEVEMQQYKDLKCTYESIVIDKNTDYKVIYNNTTWIYQFPLHIDDQVIRVKCYDGDLNFYNMIHSQILKPKEEIVAKNNKIPSHRPSVLIFTIDSMSRGNFIRCLPKTYEYLVGKHKMHVFKGLNKVADNTFPNMMALLAGFMGYPRIDMPHMPVWTIKLNSTLKKFDDMPIVWKTFRDAGYLTMYAEEYLDAIFSLLEPGFLNDPVDYYYRSTYVSLKETLSNIEHNKLKFWDRSKWRYCLANEPSYKYMLNYTEEFLTEMADLRYFALSFFVEMSHEYLNDVKNMDLDVVQFFERMFDKDLFKNTIILVMGDHGHRFDGIRSTYIGRIEERMPFLGILLPETLQKSHPHLQSGLASHTERLLSWYDIHETLVDISLDDLGEKSANIRPKAIGKSIFRPFNDNRTCTQIGILPEYCMCDREAQISLDSEKAITSANIIMQNLNSLLEDAPNYIKTGESRTCAPLLLNKILSATASMKSFSLSSSLVVRVIFEVLPSMGLFEAAVEYGPVTDPRLFGDINRINKYGDQPSCISHDILRLYCYCI